MLEAPASEVTFLFTEVEGSARAWQQHPAAMQQAAAQLDQIIRSAVANHGGHIFQVIGDAYCVAFATPSTALATAVEAQRALQQAAWIGEIGKLTVKMALHTGLAEQRGADYFAPHTLNRISRLLAAAHGGQIIATATTIRSADATSGEWQLRDLGDRRLRDVPQSEHLYQIVAPGLSTDSPPLKTLDARPHNLPAAATAFIGRTHEVGHAAALARKHRLVTLSGPGGTGKTRLSLEVAAQLLDEFTHGAYFVALAASSDPTAVVAGIASVLGVRENGRQPLLTALQEYLSARELLLLLDNFEQAVAAAPVVAELLTAAPQLRVIVTSRIPLRLAGEQEYPLPPLQLPDPANLPPAAQLAQNEAVALFVSRAQSARFEFTLDEPSAAAVAGICRQLDGLPLAIELAAVWVRTFSAAEILVRLNRRLELLTTGARNLPARQRSLRRAIDWSYDLLTAAQQRLFARLSVFVGGCTVEAAAIVCLHREVVDGNLLSAAEIQNLKSRMAELMGNSLVREEQGADGPRYLMLETIREYAQEKLAESDEEQAIRQRQADFYLTLAERAEPELSGERQVEWLVRLEQEHDNFRAALDWMLSHKQAETAARIASSIHIFWHRRGYLSEGRRWLTAALQDESLPLPVQAKASGAAGQLAIIQHDLPSAREMYTRSLTLARQLDEPARIANALSALGNIAWLEQEFAVAQQFHEEHLRLSREADDRQGVAVALANLGDVAGRMIGYQAARDLYEQAWVMQQELGNRRGMMVALATLGQVACQQDDFSAACDYFAEALRLAREIEDRPAIGSQLISQSLAMRKRSEFAAAYAAASEGLALWAEINNLVNISRALYEIAAIAVGQAQHERATRLFAAAQRIRKTSGVPLVPFLQAEYDACLALAQVALDETRFASIWEAGRTLTMTQVLAEALNEG